MTEAAQFYDSRVTGLGFRFLQAIEVALQDLRSNPLRPSPDKLQRRKQRVARFPYHLIYKVRQDEAFVLAVAHGSRKPGYWEARDH